MKRWRTVAMLIIVGACIQNSPEIAKKANSSSPPSIWFVTPQREQVVSGLVTVRCEGEDGSAIKRDSMRLWLQLPGTEEDLGISLFEDVERETVLNKGLISAKLRSGELAFDGIYELGCTMADTHKGAVATLVMPIVVNNEGATVEIRQPAEDGVTVEGTVTVECLCFDAQGVQCELVSPSQDADNVSVTFPKEGHILATWSTTEEADGEYVVQCRGGSPGTEPVTASRVVTLDNRKAVTVCGKAFGVSPLVGVKLQAIEMLLEQNTQPRIYAETTTDEAGAWCLRIDADIDHFLVSSTGWGGTFVSSVTRDEVDLGRAELQLYLEHHPGEQEQSVNDLSLHPGTTFIAATCRGLMRSGWSRQEACLEAGALWSHYLFGDEPVDLQWIPPLPSLLGSEPIGASESSQKLALWIAALDYFSFWYSAEAGLPVSGRGWHHTMQSWVRDLEPDGLFNEVDSAGNSIFVTPQYRHTTISPRLHTAEAGIRWMRGIPLPNGQQVDTNRTPLVAQTFRLFWNHLATVDSNLFAVGYLSGGEPDWSPPEVEQLPEDDGFIEGEQQLCWPVNDDARGLEVQLTSDLEPENRTFEDGLLCADFDSSGQQEDGAVTVDIVARDSVNVTEKSFTYEVNNRDPRVVFLSPTSPDGGTPVLEGRADVVVQCTDGNGIATCAVDEEGLEDLDADPALFRADWSIGQLEDGRRTLTARGVDKGGRSKTATLDVIIGNLEPVVYAGRAFLAGQPLVGAEVVVYPQRDAERGDAVASTTTGELGEFVLTVDGMAAGPIQFGVTGPESSIIHPVSGQPMSIGDLELTMALVHQPTQTPQHDSHLGISYATTLADSAARGRHLRRRSSYAAELDKVYDLMGRHINAGRPLDLRHTWEVDLLQGGAGIEAGYPVQLTLFGIGAFRSAADITALYGEFIGFLPFSRFLSLLKLDAAEGRFDGLTLSESGQPRSILMLEDYGVYLGPQQLRGDKAGAIMRWVDNVRSRPAMPGLNSTTLRADDLQAFLNFMATNTCDLFGDMPPEPLNWTAPRLEGSVTMRTDSARVCVNIETDSAIVEYGSEPALAGLSLQDNQLCGSLDTAALDDGEYSVTLWVRDYFGRRAEVTEPVEVNRKPPTVRLDSPIVSVVSGTVTIEGQCLDGNGISVCELLAPAGLEDLQSSSVDRFRFRWQTTSAPEGEMQLRIRAVDAGSSPRETVHTVTVKVDNIEPGRLCGAAFGDSPLRDYSVAVYAYEGASRGKELGRSSSGQGDGIAETDFCVEMPDTYAGPILVVAGGSEAHYASAAGDTEVFVGERELTLLLEDYRPGQVLDGLSLNYQSKVAACFATAYEVRRPVWLHVGSFAERSGMAHELVSEHMYKPDNPSNIIDVRRTPPRDMVTDSKYSRYTSYASTALGYVSAGFGRVGAETVLAAPLSGDIADLPGIAIADLLCQDAGDAVLNGKDRLGTQIYFTESGRVPVTAELYRHVLAYAMLRWGDNAVLPDGSAGTNQTGLESRTYSQPGGLLDTLCTDGSRLFAVDVPPQPFDREPPRLLSLQIQDAGGQIPIGDDFVLPRPVRGTVTLLVELDDISGVQQTEIRLPGIPQGAISADRAAQSEAIAEVQVWSNGVPRVSDGQYMVTITSRDVVLNEMEPIVLMVTFDNTSPVVTARGPQGRVNKTQVTVSGTVADDSDIVQMKFYVEGQEQVSREGPPASDNPRELNPDAYSQALAIACNVASDVRILALDAAGNAGDAELEVECDNGRPRGRLLETKTIPATSIPWEFRNDGREIAYLDPRQNDTAVRVVVSQGAVFVKHWNRLHIGSENPIPVKAWFTDEPADGNAEVFSETSAMRIGYEYWVQRRGESEAELVRPRRWLDYPDNGDGYVVTVSYEDLSPSLKRTHPEDRHIIKFVAQDEAMNEGELTFEFGLKLISAPVLYDFCHVKETLTARTLASSTTHELNSGHLDYAEGFISFPIDDDILNGQLRLRIVSRPGLDMIPAELRFDKHLEPVVRFRNAGPWCTSWDYPDETGYTTFHEIAWEPGRARMCDAEHFGNGPDYDAIIYRRPGDDPGSGSRHLQEDFRWLYSAWEFEASPTVKIYEADGIEMMRDVDDQSVFLMDVGARRKKLVLNSGDTHTYYQADTTDPYVKVPYPWEQYELVQLEDEDGHDVCYEPGQCSDITTKRYVMAHVYLNQSSGTRDETISSYAPIYISKMWVGMSYPWFTATHPDLPYVEIPLEATDLNCLVQNWLWEEPIGSRW